MGCGEPLHRLGVGPDGLGRLPLGGQVKPEGADLGLERARVKRLAPPGARLRTSIVFLSSCGSAETDVSTLERLRRSENRENSPCSSMALPLFLLFAQVRGPADVP